MKKALIICFILICGIILAQDPVSTSAEATAAPVAEVISDNGLSVGSAIWTFLNSSVGISIVAFFLSIVFGKIFTAKPKWKQYVLKYGPEIMRAVKVAEKKVTNGSKLDEALKYLIELEPKLKGATEADLKQALTAVHTSAEANGNLK